MGPKLRARLSNLAALSTEELSALIADLVSAFDVLDDSNGDMEALNEIADAIDLVKEEQAGREDRSALRNRVHQEMGEDQPLITEHTEITNPTPEEAAEAAEEDEDEDEDEDEEVPTEEAPPQEPQQASGSRRPTLSQVSKAAGKRAPKRTSEPRVTTRLMAAGDISGYSTGQDITTSRDLATAMARKLQAIGAGGKGDRVLVATLVKEYPEDRTFTEDAWHNSDLIESVINPKALVAYGGICSPMTVDYTVDTIGSTARPLQASLPSFNAVRGGVTYNVPPALSSVTPPTPWTLAMDSGGTATKTCLTVSCGSSTTANIYGIPVCIKVGNLAGRFTPEWLNAEQALLDVAAARTAELQLLSIIDAGSIATTSGLVLGATRDILTTIDRLNAGYRYRNRLDTAQLRNVLPAWVKDMIRADRAMELAHGDTDANLSVTDAQIAQWFSARNISPVWMLEDAAGGMGGAQAAGAVNDFPATFVMHIYAEGTWQFLDGGRIDLGVVRDSTLNATNDYEIWREDFEGVAKRGNESLKVTVTTKETGMTAGTKDTSSF